MSDLLERFRLLDRVGVPDLRQRIENPGKPPAPRRPRRRLLVAAVALLIGLAPLALLARGFLRSENEQVAGKQRFNETAYGTYVFRNIRIELPRGRDSRGIEARHTVDVVSTWEWTQDQYPGEHECSWVVFDAEGREIGAMTGELASQLPKTSHPIAIEIRVDVSLAERAEITCDAARLDTPVAYGISDERVAGTFAWRDRISGVEVTFDVSWPVKLPDYPGTNECTAVLSRRSGEIVARQVFGLGVGPGPVTSRVRKDEFLDRSAIDDADRLLANVECRPFTGEGAVSG